MRILVVQESDWLKRNPHQQHHLMERLNKSKYGQDVAKKMEWEIEELCKLGKNQPELLEVALEELWARKPALYKSVVINAYLDEKIYLGKAAELLGVHRLVLQKELIEKGVPIRGLSKDEVIAEVGAIKAWRKDLL